MGGRALDGARDEIREGEMLVLDKVDLVVVVGEGGGVGVDKVFRARMEV